MQMMLGGDFYYKYDRYKDLDIRAAHQQMQNFSDSHTVRGLKISQPDKRPFLNASSQTNVDGLKNPTEGPGFLSIKAAMEKLLPINIANYYGSIQFNK